VEKYWQLNVRKPFEKIGKKAYFEPDFSQQHSTRSSNRFALLIVAMLCASM